MFEHEYDDYDDDIEDSSLRDYDDYDDDIEDSSLRDYDDWVCDCDICARKQQHIECDLDYGTYEDHEPEEEIKETPERQDFTCNKCVSVHYCEYAWDDFNLNGKCLAR